MGISIWQIVLVLVIILILFGAGKIPRVMGDVAKGIKSFKKGMSSDPIEDNEPKNISEENIDSSNSEENKDSTNKE